MALFESLGLHNPEDLLRQTMQLLREVVVGLLLVAHVVRDLPNFVAQVSDLCAGLSFLGDQQVV